MLLQRPLTWLLLWLGASVTACRPAERGPTTDHPTLRLIDSITLQETDSTLLGDLGPNLTVDAEGDLYVTEQQSSRLFRFRPSGSLAMVFGRRGQGPGEFGYVGPVIVVADSFVLVQARRAIQVFGRSSGRYLKSVPFEGLSLTSGTATASHFVWGNLSRSADHVVMVAARATVLAETDADSAALRPTLHALPAEYIRYPELERFYLVPIAAWTDTLVVGFAAVNWLVRSRLDGTPIDTVDVPATRRRGTSPSALEAFGAVPFDFAKAYRAISATYAIWRLPTGTFAVWHQDGSPDLSRPDRPQLIAQAYISILTADLSAACVDAQVSTPGTARPRLTMRADTLYALDQVVDPTALTGVRTVVRRYLVSTDGCVWQATTRRRG